ncbi:hypothetical protein [Ancylobacter radicis]|uniref:Uncharacterized protein n=1 Tax=Ancylobacter radicis TaxID=2836179 RepID=A0ABS5R6X0_9HYPH|nr:hypothetical protein [Ancylobacter radicis]MBS9477423.1 hypothetical protein [Ancylobacter radicis]
MMTPPSRSITPAVPVLDATITGASRTGASSAGERPAPGEAPSGPARAAHPEEMKASAEIRLGRALTMSATARITPAGMIAVGLATGVILLGVAAVVRAGRRAKYQQYF